MAAEVAASAGHVVSVYDQHRSPARKFVLAGRGGLNITHSEPFDDFLDRYGPERQHVEPAIRGFSPDDLRSWCEELGHPTFVGSSGRVFPEEFRAVPLLRSWLRRLEELGVTFRPQHSWLGWDGDALQFVAPDGPLAVDADRTVLALGGASWPRVGSDGSWTAILADRGVEVEALRSANCGVNVEWSRVMVDKFAGEPLKNVSVVVDGEAVRGDPIVTTTGLEGGPIYAHSRRIRERLDAGANIIEIDLMPDRDFDSLEQLLSSKQKKGDSTAKWFRNCGISKVASSLMREATGNDLPKDAAEVAELAKAVPITITAMAGINRAISSAGGVAWSEVDEGLQLNKLPNVHVVGEMLNWEAPTGGYLLQACFSTAHHAAAGM